MKNEGLHKVPTDLDLMQGARMQVNDRIYGLVDRRFEAVSEEEKG